MIKLKSLSHSCLIFIILTIFFGCNSPAEKSDNSWIYQENTGENQIKRKYILPVDIKNITNSPEATIENTDALLTNNSGQADLAGANLCVLSGNNIANPAILIDFGKELHGGIEIITGAFDKGHQMKIRLTLGESISEALSKVENSTATNDHAMRDFEVTLPWLGKINIGNSGFRYAKIELLDKDVTLNLKEVRAISVMRDIPYLGSFKCNDDRLNRIWETGAYTVHLNMQEFLWDGIKRDRLVWVGDMHPEVMTILSVFGYNEVVPKSLDFIQNITQLPSWMNGISSYSMWWIILQYQWYMNTGDLNYLESHKTDVYELLEQLSTKIDDNGKEFLDGFRFLDWPTSPNKEAIHAGLQSMMIMSFEAGAEIAAIFGDIESQDKYLTTIKELKRHVPVPNGSKSGGALMALSGLSDPPAMNDTLLSINPNNGISSFYGYYVLKARAEAGDITGSLNVIRDYWGVMLDMGATTFWEDFDLSWTENATGIDEMPVEDKSDIHADNGGYCYVGLRNSLCHGWASGPTAWLSEYVLGVKPIEPGCKKVLIKPNLGDLDWAEGTFPTPWGLIKIRHQKDANGKVASEVTGPKEVEIVY